jgi:uncharacterized membrane protein YoaK (UPF0700 family)
MRLALQKIGLLNKSTGIYLITALSGMIDAACFIALGGVFAEMMTGNLLMLSFSIATKGITDNLNRYILVLAFYVLGVYFCARILRAPKIWRGKRFGFLVEWIFIATTAILSAIYSPDDFNLSGQIILSLLALSMGMQNVLIRIHGIPDLATNLMTATFTALIADTRLAGGDNSNWGRRLFSILIFILSATVGAFLVQFGLFWPLFLATLVLGVALIPLLFGE